MPYPITVGYLDLNVSVSVNVNLSDTNSIILNFTRADCTDLSIHNIDYHAEYINILKEVTLFLNYNIIYFRLLIWE